MQNAKLKDVIRFSTDWKIILINIFILMNGTMLALNTDNMKNLVFNTSLWIEETAFMKAECQAWFLNIILWSANGNSIPNNYKALAKAAKSEENGPEFERFKVGFKNHISRYLHLDKKTNTVTVTKSLKIFSPIEKKKRSIKNFFPMIIEPDMQPIFDRWLLYKKNKGQSYSDEMSLDAAYKRLYKLSMGDAVVAESIIDNAISCNYSGFFAEKNAFKQEIPKFDKLKEAFKGAQNPHR